MPPSPIKSHESTTDFTGLTPNLIDNVKFLVARIFFRFAGVYEIEFSTILNLLQIDTCSQQDNVKERTLKSDLRTCKFQV